MRLEQVEMVLSMRHYSVRTKKAYCQWIRRFVAYHQKRHPKEMGETEVANFLSHLASNLKVSASTQNQALAALLFLYQHVVGRELDWLVGVERAKTPVKLPCVLTRNEVFAVLSRLREPTWLVAALMSALVAEYALRSSASPIGVSEYRFVESLPKDLEASLPSIARIEEELSHLRTPRARSTRKGEEKKGEL